MAAALVGGHNSFDPARLGEIRYLERRIDSARIAAIPVELQQRVDEHNKIGPSPAASVNVEVTNSLAMVWGTTMTSRGRRHHPPTSVYHGSCRQDRASR